MNQYRLDDLPLEIQKDLYETLKKKFASRDSSRISKEKRVKAAADILHCLTGFTLAQQRSILLFTLTIIKNSQHRFWRDGHQGKETR